MTHEFRSKGLISLALTGSLALFAPLAGANVVPPYAQSFNDAAFQGGTLVLSATSTVDSGTSDLFGATNYYTINNANGWTFGNGAFYAVQANADGTNAAPYNGAILLNEGGVSGPSSTTAPLATQDFSTTLTTVAGQWYTVQTHYFGDNRPGGSYVLDLYLNGARSASASGTDGASGSLASPYTFSYTFQAYTTSTVVGYGQSQSVNQASAIIDDISVTPVVPLPATAWLLASGVIGLLGLVGRPRAA